MGGEGLLWEVREEGVTYVLSCYCIHWYIVLINITNIVPIYNIVHRLAPPPCTNYADLLFRLQKHLDCLSSCRLSVSSSRMCVGMS